MSELDISNQSREITDMAVSAGAIVIGIIAGIDAEGRPLVDFHNNPGDTPVKALSTIMLGKNHVSRQVALLFNNGNIKEPVIMGLIQNPLDDLLENFELIPMEAEEKSPFPGSEDEERNPAEIKRDNDNTVYVDGERVTIEGSEEVTFKCGKSSITLTRSGKILIRGTYLLNRSSGVNRIMGGSVQVN